MMSEVEEVEDETTLVIPDDDIVADESSDKEQLVCIVRGRRGQKRRRFLLERKSETDEWFEVAAEHSRQSSPCEADSGHICSRECYGARLWHESADSYAAESLKDTDKSRKQMTDYFRWRDTVPLCYDRLTVYCLPKASRSIAFVPNEEGVADGRSDRLIVASEALIADESYAKPAADKLPLREALYLQTLHTTAFHSPNPRIVHGAAVESAFSVFRIRVMPQRPHLVATRSESADIAVYWMQPQMECSSVSARMGVATKHPHMDLNENSRLCAVLTKSSGKPGFAICWSDASCGLVLCGDSGGDIHEYQLDVKCTVASSIKSMSSPKMKSVETDWNSPPTVTATHKRLIKKKGKGQRDEMWPEIRPSATYKYKRSNISETTAVEFVPGSDQLFASATAEGLLLIWDRRVTARAFVRRCLAGFENGQVTGISWNRLRLGELATADATGRIRVWDLRKLKKHSSEIQQHRSRVTAVKWCPYEAHLLASSSEDQLVCVYDTSVAMDSATATRLSPKPKWAKRLPQTAFVHAGHCAPVTEFDWAPSSRNLTIASTDLSGVVHLWTPLRDCFVSHS